MPEYVEFVRTVTVDGREFKAGDRTPAAGVAAGYLESCLRVGHCVPCDPPDQPADRKPGRK